MLTHEQQLIKHLLAMLRLARSYAASIDSDELKQQVKEVEEWIHKNI